MNKVFVERNGDWFCRLCGEGQNDGEDLEVDDVLECMNCLAACVVTEVIEDKSCDTE